MGTNENSTDGSDSSDHSCVENSFSREILEMRRLEEGDFDDADDIKWGQNGNK